MPLNKTFNQTEMDELIGKMEHGLRVKLDEFSVPPELQAYLAKIGYSTVALFQSLATNHEGVERRAKLFGLDPEKEVEEMILVSGLVGVWEDLRHLQQAFAKDRAEKKASGQMIPMKAGEYNHAKQTYEKRYKAKEDCDLPGSTIIELLEAGMESGDLKALRLSDLPSKEEVEVQTRLKRDSSGVSVNITTSGMQVSNPVRVKIPMPHDTEGVRHRLALHKSAVEFIKIRHPHNKIWKTADSEMWEDHVNYVLGPEIYGYTIKNDKGVVVKTPTLDLVMKFEEALRIKATIFMNEGGSHNGGVPQDIKAAMEAARKDNNLLQKEFLQKLMFQSGSRGSGREDPLEDDEEKTSKPRGRGKKAKAAARKAGGSGGGAAKGKGRGKDKTMKQGGKRAGKLNSKTPDLKPICYAYGSKEGCKKASCSMAHVCQICFGNHPHYACGK